MVTGRADGIFGKPKVIRTLLSAVCMTLGTFTNLILVFVIVTEWFTLWIQCPAVPKKPKNVPL